MATQLNVLAFSGSLRAASYNKKLVLQACDYLKEKNCIINFIDLKALELPIFDEDVEETIGMPEGAVRLVRAITDADALLIGNPEYNAGITGALKNAIDWVSRAEQNPFVDKVTMLIGTSSGYWGAIRSAFVTRQTLMHLKAMVLPSQVNIPFNEKAFGENGNLKDPMQVKLLHAACDDFVRAATAFKKRDA